MKAYIFKMKLTLKQINQIIEALKDHNTRLDIGWRFDEELRCLYIVKNKPNCDSNMYTVSINNKLFFTATQVGIINWFHEMEEYGTFELITKIKTKTKGLINNI